MRPAPDWSTSDLDSLRKGADGGDPDAQWWLARRYRDGDGLERNPALALRWIARSVRGEPDHAAWVGEWFRYGEHGFPKSRDQEIAWYRFAARHGSATGMFDLAWALISEGDVQVSFPAAARWCRRAIRLGHGRAALHLGRWTWLVEHDEAAARRWLRIALVHPTDDAGVYLEWLDRTALWCRLLASRPMDETAESAERGDRDAAFRWGVARLHGFGVPKELESGEAWLTQAADAGHRDAQLALGFHEYVMGRGEGCMDTALACFRRAARGGDPVAHYCAAMNLVNYSGWPDDYRLAVRHLRRAAAGGCRFAAFELGDYHTEGNGVRRDKRAADRWYLESARLGDPRGQNCAGELYLEGCASFGKDAGRAAEWFRRAAQQGHPIAQLSLGVLLREGRGVRRGDREAVRWYRRAAALGDDDAMCNLYLCHRFGHGVPKHRRLAFGWLRRSAALRNVRAQIRLGRALYTGDGIRRDRAEGVRCCRRAAARAADLPWTLGTCAKEELPGAEDIVAHGYEEGHGVARDDAKAYAWWRRAAKHGDLCATYNVGLCYLGGRGVARSRRSALRWIRKAASRGHQPSKKRLRALTGAATRAARR